MTSKDFFVALNMMATERGMEVSEIIKDLEEALSVAFRKAHGEAMNARVALNPERNTIRVYSYKTVVAEEDEKLDSDEEGFVPFDYDGVTNVKIRDKFKLCNAYAREKCKDCWAKLYCSGGCSANSYHSTGDITGVYEYGCELFKKRIECAIMMKVAESEEKL